MSRQLRRDEKFVRFKTNRPCLTCGAPGDCHQMGETWACPKFNKARRKFIAVRRK